MLTPIENCARDAAGRETSAPARRALQRSRILKVFIRNRLFYTFVDRSKRFGQQVFNRHSATHPDSSEFVALSIGVTHICAVFSSGLCIPSCFSEEKCCAGHERGFSEIYFGSNRIWRQSPAFFRIPIGWRPLCHPMGVSIPQMVCIAHAKRNSALSCGFQYLTSIPLVDLFMPANGANSAVRDELQDWVSGNHQNSIPLTK